MEGDNERMVAALARLGEFSPAVLDAMRRVPRASFLPAGTPAAEAYAIDRAVALAYDPAGRGRHATSTVSAPIIVATMLELLSLRPGLRVLEIGTGSGYNAALLASLVGDPSLVTTVDIDERLVADASARLSSLGWGDVAVVAGDGWEGVASRAPYDRIVATVGVADVAPAWVAQLAPPPADAFLLLPLHHGGVHPILQLPAAGAGGGGGGGGDVPGAVVSGRVVARSGFVAIQGHQATRAPWRHAGSGRANEPLHGAHVERLPSPLVTGGARSRTTPWDFSYWLAMADDRTANLCTLIGDDGRSIAVIDVRAGVVSWSGDGGVALRDALVAGAEEWLALGSPPAEAWHSAFVPVASAGDLEPARPGRRYLIRRVDHVQVLTLPT